MLDISSLNAAQREAVTAEHGPLLVIAGAGSGKTRTIVYRLAWLAQQDHGDLGDKGRHMLLLTFTRKAAQEMKKRAAALLGASDLAQFGGGDVRGGTFHSYAYSVLRRYAPDWAAGPVSIMDSADSTEAIRVCREQTGAGKGDRSFPHTPAVLALISKARNKELPLHELLNREAQHLLPHEDMLEKLQDAYASYKRDRCLLDYDDLLFELEQLFTDHADLLEDERSMYRQIMVDEYQDTNLVQARIVQLLARDSGKVMVVGDDAQSIYAFRGATVRNILDFPRIFPGTRIIRLEENYRSVQSVLDVSNAILEHSKEGYQKKLFSRRPVQPQTAVTLYHPYSDITQAQLVIQRIEDLLQHGVPAQEIAVLFRSGYQSYHLEVEMNKRGIGFKKYGGLRYAEAAHIKDVLAYVRLAVNPMDQISFGRIAALFKGIGGKTAQKLFELSQKDDAVAMKKACRRWPEFFEHLELVDEIRASHGTPEASLARIKEMYQPMMEWLFPDDWPRRLQGLETLTAIASAYADLPSFVAELSLDQAQEEPDEDEKACVTLSTIHSAKGLEWSAVLILDLAEDRFPTRHAVLSEENFEEERRLMYVACTRAKDTLDLFAPSNLYSRMYNDLEPVAPSPFVSELPCGLYDEIYEGRGNSMRRVQQHSGGIAALMHNNVEDVGSARGQGADSKKEAARRNVQQRADPAKLGHCRHKIFGRGKIVEKLPPDKYRVNFPGFGLKVIIGAYLEMEP